MLLCFPLLGCMFPEAVELEGMEIMCTLLLGWVTPNAWIQVWSKAYPLHLTPHMLLQTGALFWSWSFHVHAQKHLLFSLRHFNDNTQFGHWFGAPETPILWPPDAMNWLLGQGADAGKDWRQEENGTTDDEMVGWHHWLDGHEFEQALGVGDGLGSLACCSPWNCKESDTTEQLNWTWSPNHQTAKLSKNRVETIDLKGE